MRPQFDAYSEKNDWHPFVLSKNKILIKFLLTNLVGDYRLELQKGLATTNQGEKHVRGYVKGRNGRKQIEWGDFFLTL